MANVLLREVPEDEEEDERKDDEEEEDQNEEDGDGYSVNAVSGSAQTDFEGRRNSITLPLCLGGSHFDNRTSIESSGRNSPLPYRCLPREY
jgi:hypothetical protein